MKITKQQLKQIIKEEIKAVQEVLGHPGETEAGHPLVVDTDNKLHEAYLAVDALADVVDQQGISRDMINGQKTISDITSKIEGLNRLQPYLGTK